MAPVPSSSPIDPTKTTKMKTKMMMPTNDNEEWSLRITLPPASLLLSPWSVAAGKGDTWERKKEEKKKSTEEDEGSA
jgi:hypothetical protein